MAPAPSVSRSNRYVEVTRLTPIIRSLLAAVCVLSIAKNTPSLAFLVPDFDEIIAVAIECTEPWARKVETADAILNIFKVIRQKLRLLPELHR